MLFRSAGLGQVLQGDVAADGRFLQQDDQLVAQRGQYVLDGLGQDDLPGGLNYTQATWKIILPQAVKNVLPALGNELIVLLKETSISGYIALQDLTKAGDIVRSRTYSTFFPYISVALIYLVMVLFLEKVLNHMEGRLARSDR